MRAVNLLSRAGGFSLAALVGLQLLSGRLLATEPEARAMTIPVGTDIPVTIDENVPLKRDEFGKTFDAHVTRDVIVGGAVVIPAGARAEVMLIESPEQAGAAAFRLGGISIDGRMRPVRTEVARADGSQSGLSTGKKTGLGAAAGAVIGLLTGGGSGLLKGAAVGAGGGLAWGLLSHGNSEVKADTPLAFTLRDAVRI